MPSPPVNMLVPKQFVDMVKQSRLLAPNLRLLTLRYFTGNKHAGNAIARRVVQNHILALRWMNPNAIIYMREFRGQGTPRLDMMLWTGVKHIAPITSAYDEVGVAAQVLAIARDPELALEQPEEPASRALLENASAVVPKRRGSVASASQAAAAAAETSTTAAQSLR